jgi:glycolate oxidase iron-sulfur subunit
VQTNLAPEFKGTADGTEAEAILRKCVHCGFCTATCPTYQLLGDELDGPRGRIYLIKQVLEGVTPTAATQLHLDRCLTCRNCETTCPSGVQYGRLVDIGRRLVEEQVERPFAERSTRTLLRAGLTSSAFAPALKLGQLMRPFLPASLKNKVPASAGARAHQWPTRTLDRKVLLLTGCVQPAMAPNINSATARVLDAAGIQTLVADSAGCCGAIREHLADHDGALADMRRNIDAWTAVIDRQRIEAIVINASGCSVTVKDYAYALRHDKRYAERAERISSMARDLSQLLPSIVPMLKKKLEIKHGGKPGADALPARRIAYHPPCTLQHGQQLRGDVEMGLAALGFEVSLPMSESHLCCGSAGTYSVLQPELAYRLRDRKLEHLKALEPERVVSANVGCIQHLQSGTATPVTHWVELVDELLGA